MLLRNCHTARLLLPRTLPGLRTQQIRPFTRKNTKTRLRSLSNYRDNEWIGSSKNEDHIPGFKAHSAYSRELSIQGEASIFTKDNDFKQLMYEVFGHLKQTITTNTFIYQVYESSSISHSAEEALDEFRTKLEKSLKDFQNAEKSKFSFDQLISPNVENTPMLIYNILKCDPTVQKYFEKQGISDIVERAYQILEKSYHGLLFTHLSINLPARKLGVDISNPAEWFPKARKLKRKLILHVGPTNSGKTYHALRRLKESNDGYYAGPLRLLAREIYERFQSEGIRCNLITGEDVVKDLDEYGIAAPLSSGTVEMISTSSKYEVVVLDEIQMMGDPERGWAWTNALLGVQAKEVHLCGEESVVPLIQKIANITGDEVIVNKYERLGELKVEEDIIYDGVKGLQKGDCIVAFSKRRILAYKQAIQEESNLKCGVIYGALPAEVRSTEADKFNSGEYDVLVASDAIGMGLNLSITRVIFDSHFKFDGKGLQELESPIVKQIGGRAGRFKVAPSIGTPVKTETVNPKNAKTSTGGYVGAFLPHTLKHIEENMSKDTIFLKKAYIWPSDEIWCQYTSEFPSGTAFTNVIESFEREVKSVPLYTIGGTKQRTSMGEVFVKMPNLLISDQLRIGTAPLSLRVPLFQEVIHAFSDIIDKRQTKSILEFDILPFHLLNSASQREDKLEGLEELHKYVLLFLWMNNRYPTLFVNRESAVEIKTLLESMIEKLLVDVKQRDIGGSRHRRRPRQYGQRPKFVK